MFLVALILPIVVPIAIASTLRGLSNDPKYSTYWSTVLGAMVLWSVIALVAFIKMFDVQATRPEHIAGGPGPGLENLGELVGWVALFGPSFPALLATIAMRTGKFRFGVLEFLLAVIIPAVLLAVGRYYYSEHLAERAPRQQWFNMGITPGLDDTGKPVELMFTRSSNLDALDGQEQLKSLSVSADPAEFAKLRFVPNLVNLKIGGPKTTDETLTYLKFVPKLRSLSIRYSRVTDEGLAALAVLPELEVLDMNWTTLSDKGLDQLRGLDRLRSLEAYGTKITGHGFCQGGFARLSDLTLHDCPVDEAGLRCIIALPAIGSIAMYHTNVTEAAIRQIERELKAAGSNIDIRWLPKR